VQRVEGCSSEIEVSSSFHEIQLLGAEVSPLYCGCRTPPYMHGSMLVPQYWGGAELSNWILRPPNVARTTVFPVLGNVVSSPSKVLCVWARWTGCKFPGHMDAAVKHCSGFTLESI
jgi:hypothetical protein